jgi:uracil-DNA glycosylase family 4
MMTEEEFLAQGFHPKIEGAECWRCPLFLGSEFVPPVGPAQASTAFCGEAPGAQEGRRGVPFIGPSGQLLDSVLSHYGIPRETVLLTNAALCRDPSGATPTATALSACRPRLVAELRDHGVKDVVALGNSAAQSILRTSVGITSLRIGSGRTNEKDLPGVRVIPTLHPAYCLRNPDGFPSVVTDIGKLKGFAGEWYEPKFKIYDTEAEALACLAALEARDPHGQDEVTLDIESDIEKDVSFETPLRHKMLCIGMSYELGKVVVIGEVALEFNSVRDALLRYLRRRKLIGQNMKFDLKGLWAYLGEALKVYFDTMLASYSLDERPRIHGLEYQGIEKLGTPDWKGEIVKYKRPGEGYGAIPRAVLYKYNAYDVHVTALLRVLLAKELAASSGGGEARPRADGSIWGLPELHDFLCRASNELMFVELNGMKIDLPYNDKLTVEYVDILTAKREAIVDTIPDREIFNPNSPKQVKEVVKDTFGWTLPRKMNQKKEYAETTDVDALTGLFEKAVLLGSPSAEFFRLMLEHRKEAKLYGTYIKGIRQRMWRGRVYSTFNLHTTTTGRLSSRNPNLQNIPRGSAMRRQFIPSKDDNVFLEADFGQAELRVLCYLAQDEYLRSVFNDPTRDLFNELTPRLYGDVSELDASALKELRIRVKAYVYGLSYGREAQSIAMEYNIPMNEAVRGMQAFFQVIPATVAFRDATRNKVLNREDLITHYGRHRRFWLITKENRHEVLNEALAFLPQSTSSDICLDAFCHLRPRLKGTGMYVRNLVHDSILLETPASQVHRAKEMLQQEMLASAQRVVGDYVMFKTDMSVGKSWGTLAKYDENRDYVTEPIEALAA